MKKIRILIAEDHKLVRETWTSIINMDEGLEVIAACADTAEAISIVIAELPDIVLMDINIHPLNGFQATARISQISLDCKVIGLSYHSEMVAVQKMFAAGASGYLTKNCGCSELIEAIVQVHGGNKFVCQEMREKGFEVAPLSEVQTEQLGIFLTTKEMLVSNYIRNGFRTKEIAKELKISIRTVSTHRYNIFRKLNVKNSISLVRLMNSNPCLAHI
jgi:DNA-binding NarL/FixJ family response regulator